MAAGITARGAAGFGVVHLAAQGALPGAGVGVAASAVGAGARVAGAHSLCEGAVVAGRTGAGDDGSLVIECDDRYPTAGLLGVAGIADVVGL